MDLDVRLSELDVLEFLGVDFTHVSPPDGTEAVHAIKVREQSRSGIREHQGQAQAQTPEPLTAPGPAAPLSSEIATAALFGWTGPAGSTAAKLFAAASTAPGPPYKVNAPAFGLQVKAAPASQPGPKAPTIEVIIPPGSVKAEQMGQVMVEEQVVAEVQPEGSWQEVTSSPPRVSISSVPNEL